MPSFRSQKLSLVLLLATLQLAVAQDAGLEEQLRTVTVRNITAMQAEDHGALTETMHPDSPSYQNSLALATRLGQAYDLNYRLIEFRLITLDEEYAYARVRQETSKIQGPEFADNLLSALWIYRQHEGNWKIWSLAVLEVDLL